MESEKGLKTLEMVVVVARWIAKQSRSHTRHTHTHTLKCSDTATEEAAVDDGGEKNLQFSPLYLQDEGSYKIEMQSAPFN